MDGQGMSWRREMLRADTVVMAFGGADDAVIDAVRAECRARGYGPDDVRIVKRDDQILAIAKRDLHVKK
jgi:hypothetical protein